MSGLTLKSVADWFKEIFYGEDSTVRTKEIVGLPAVWYCLNRASGCMVQMPLILYEKTGRTIREAVEHPAFYMVKQQPSPYMTASCFQQLMTVHALLWGNGRAFIRREGTKPVEMIPLMPDRTRTMMVDGRIWHVTKPLRDERLPLFKDMENDAEGTIVLPDEDVFHLPGLSVDGVEGLSLAEVARRTFGIEISATKRVQSQMKKGFTSAMLLEDTQNLYKKEEDAKAFLDSFRKIHSTEESGGTIGMLRNGMKATVLQMSNTDAQFIEQRQFDRQDIALLFGVESMPGDNSSVSYNSLEQKNLTFLVNSLGPIKTKYEQQMFKVLTERERREHKLYFKFHQGALLQTDMKTTIDLLRSSIEATIYSPNEARAKLDENPYEGGDKYENPNVKSRNDQNSEPPATQSNSIDPTAASVSSRIKHLIKVECERVRNGCKAKDFCGWMDDFYNRWQSTIGNVIEELGGSTEIAAIHCEQSRQLLLDCAGVAKNSDELLTSVSEMVAGWEARADALAKSILKGQEK
jgi:HK97 family phage portal protein